MNKLFSKFFIIFSLLAFLATSAIPVTEAHADYGSKGHKHTNHYHKVKSYTKKDGTRVKSHARRTHR